MWAQALAYRRFGGPEVLELIKTWVPEPGPGQVRVLVHAGGLNPIDGKLRSGAFSAGLPVLTPARLGSEISGVVDAVGEGVEEFSPGQKVIGIVPERTGHAEAVISEAENLAPMPSHISWGVGAAIAAGGLSAHGALKSINFAAGDTLIAHAASGSVGSHAVQLARLWGAPTVIGTASEANHDYLRSLGVIPVTYGPGLGERLRAVLPAGARVKMLDAAGMDAVAESIDLVADPAEDCISLLPFVDKEFGVKFNMMNYDGAVLRELSQLFADQAMRLREPIAFAFDDAASAHRLLDTGHSGGKIVLNMR